MNHDNNSLVALSIKIIGHCKSEPALKVSIKPVWRADLKMIPAIYFLAFHSSWDQTSQSLYPHSGTHGQVSLHQWVFPIPGNCELVYRKSLIEATNY